MSVFFLAFEFFQLRVRAAVTQAAAALQATLRAAAAGHRACAHEARKRVQWNETRLSYRRCLQQLLLKFKI